MPEATEMQQMELDMVEGMYADHFKCLSVSPPSYSITFSATPDDAQEMKITITYPDEAYPEEGSPILLVENISKDRRVPVHLLQQELDAMAADNVGMHIAVLVLQRCQDFLTNVVEEQDKSTLQKRGDTLAAASTVAVVVDPTIRMGNAISRENFEEWRVRHMAEKMARKSEEAKRTVREFASKLTGKQLWDSTLRNADWELFGGTDGDDAGVDIDDTEYENYEFGDDDDGSDNDAD